MKRLIALVAIAAAATFGLTGAAGAVDENAPHNHDGTQNGAHPHHVHTGDGECNDLDGPNFEGGAPDGARGRHKAAFQSGQVHHGTCANGQH